jgi:hypothetical protein
VSYSIENKSGKQGIQTICLEFHLNLALTVIVYTLGKCGCMTVLRKSIDCLKLLSKTKIVVSLEKTEEESLQTPRRKSLLVEK